MSPRRLLSTAPCCPGAAEIPPHMRNICTRSLEVSAVVWCADSAVTGCPAASSMPVGRCVWLSAGIIGTVVSWLVGRARLGRSEKAGKKREGRKEMNRIPDREAYLIWHFRLRPSLLRAVTPVVLHIYSTQGIMLAVFLASYCQK